MFKYLKGGSIYGKLIVLIGILTAVPLIVLPFYPGETGHIPAFLAPSIVSIAAGIGVCGMTYTKKEDVGQSSVKRSSLVILFTWTYSFLLGAMPFVIAGELSFIQALFESVSGWTTTGLSVADVTVMPKIFLFHRSFLQYCGGLGLILMIIVITQSKQSMPLYSAEGHTDRIMPSLKQTARVISMIYGGYLILGTVLYAAFGMEVFDAVCHTMSALSTAGFTTQAQSIGQYASLPIEIITVVLMLIGASNFAVLLLLTEGKLRQVFRVTEMRFMLGLLVVFVPLTAFSLAAQ
ncbi:MAG: TrkH family potassium uptake protein, partial [Clostridiales bacterium]|nr:TrkH family potassium uptake protein [Clostridiales bacterium]